eukprot:scaffold115206_cov31-Tisochrysis_lutea.AAC.2
MPRALPLISGATCSVSGSHTVSKEDRRTRCRRGRMEPPRCHDGIEEMSTLNIRHLPPWIKSPVKTEYHTHGASILATMALCSTSRSTQPCAGNGTRTLRAPRSITGRTSTSLPMVQAFSTSNNDREKFFTSFSGSFARSRSASAGWVA